MGGAIAGTSILKVPIKNEKKEQKPKEETETCNLNSEQHM